MLSGPSDGTAGVGGTFWQWVEWGHGVLTLQLMSLMSNVWRSPGGRRSGSTSKWGGRREKKQNQTWKHKKPKEVCLISLFCASSSPLSPLSSCCPPGNRSQHVIMKDVSILKMHLGDKWIRIYISFFSPLAPVTKNSVRQLEKVWEQEFILYSKLHQLFEMIKCTMKLSAHHHLLRAMQGAVLTSIMTSPLDLIQIKVNASCHVHCYAHLGGMIKYVIEKQWTDDAAVSHVIFNSFYTESSKARMSHTVKSLSSWFSCSHLEWGTNMQGKEARRGIGDKKVSLFSHFLNI